MIQDAQQPVRIPFNKASLLGTEVQAMRDAVESGHISGNGPYTKKCHAFLERELGIQKALLTTSCTHALEMTALLLDIKPGDEVIVPSFTFVSTVNAFVLRGAQPVFVDIRRDTLNLDESKLEAAITSRTKTIVVVHYAGVGCEMDRIMKIAMRHDIPVVEDNAHGLFGRYKGKPLGTFGCMATQSFHETKNFTCGEGGALLINDARYCERSEIIWEKGTDRSLFFRGQVDKYSWVDVGSSYLPSDLLAAFLLVQLQARREIQQKRQQIWEFYANHLRAWAQNNGIRLPVIPPDCEQAYHMFYIIMPSLRHRQALIAFMKSRGILSIFHYLPLHLSGMGRRYGGKEGDCPTTEYVSERLLRLPFYYSLTEEEQGDVVKAILSCDAL